jgi:hypothetical protein
VKEEAILKEVKEGKEKQQKKVKTLQPDKEIFCK